MSREVTERRKCDKCGAVIYKDLGAWIGAVATFEVSWTTSVVLQEKRTYDLCPPCAKYVQGLIEGTNF
jgi:hypothetical protein